MSRKNVMMFASYNIARAINGTLIVRTLKGLLERNRIPKDRHTEVQNWANIMASTFIKTIWAD